MIHIKEANEENYDIKSICNIHNNSFSYWIDTLGEQYGYTKIQKKDVLNWIKNEKSLILIASFNDNPVGYIHLFFEEIYGDRGNFSNMVLVETKESLGQSKIAILPQFQRKKIATSLIENALDIAKMKKVKTVMAFSYNENYNANKMFEKLGFIHEPFFYYEFYSKNKPYIHDSVLAEFNFKNKLPVIELNLNVQIRRIKKSDLEDMRIIFGECRPDVFGVNPSTNQIKNWYKSKWAIETLVADFKGKVVGCMEYTKKGIIGIPGVLKEYRRKKIGQTLFYYLLYNMKKSGIKKALADTGFILSEAINLYQKFNFNLSRELWGWIKIL